MLRQTIIEAIGNLLASRQRSILALVGILIGAAAVIAMLNVGAMARNETVKQFQQMGTDVLSIRSGQPVGLNLADVEGLPGAVPGLAAVAPFASGNAVADFEGMVKTASVVGVTEAFVEVANLQVREGRFISNLDRFELYCVVGSRIAAKLSSAEFPLRVGSNLRLGRYVYRVIGVLAPAQDSPMLSVQINDSVFISMPNSRRTLSLASLASVVARMRPGSDPNVVAEQVVAYFSSKFGGSGIDVQSAQDLIAGMASQMRLFQLLLGAVGGIALVLGGVGVMNIMLVSVQERHREIGIRLAIGARRRDIQSLFLSEAVILAFLGAVLGIGLGLASSYVFARFSNWQFLLSPVAAPLGAGVSIVVGIFFGFYPAFLASRLDPIEALRSE